MDYTGGSFLDSSMDYNDRSVLINFEGAGPTQEAIRVFLKRNYNIEVYVITCITPPSTYLGFVNCGSIHVDVATNM